MYNVRHLQVVLPWEHTPDSRDILESDMNLMRVRTLRAVTAGSAMVRTPTYLVQLV